MPTLHEWLVGIGGGFAASVLLFLVLFTLRPRLRISTRITKLLSDGPAPEYRYRVKIVNRSFRSCVDVSVHVFLVTQRTVPGKKIGKTAILSTLESMGESRAIGFYPGYRPWDKDAHYAQRLRLNAHCIGRWEADDNQYLLIRVVARDGVSGFPRVFSKEYRLATQLVEGKTFVGGRSTRVVTYAQRGGRQDPQPAVTPPSHGEEPTH